MIKNSCAKFQQTALCIVLYILVHPKTIVFRRTYVLAQMFIFLQREISEMRGPTGVKFCTMVSTRPYFIIYVKNCSVYIQCKGDIVVTVMGVTFLTNHNNNLK